MRYFHPLTIWFVLLLGLGLVGCSDDNNDAFCAQAEFFQLLGTRDMDESQAELTDEDFFNALVALRDLSPASLREDFDAIVDFEANYDQSTAEEENVEIDAATTRVGRAIEQMCGIQLPGIS